jgi:exodeoxyribonuclease V alpha subunit
MAEDVVEGIVERITYRNAASDYTVARLRDDEAGTLFTVVGVLPGLHEGERASLTGCWTEHPRYGRQFKATGFHVVAPTTVEGVERFLGSGVLKGVGPSTAAEIVRHFGVGALDVLDRDADRLLEIPGIGEKRLASIVESWREKSQLRDLMIFLHSHGLSGAHAARIHDRFGAQAVQVILRNPYCLADEIWGIGFVTADRIAQKLGIDPGSSERIDSGIRYVLGQAVEQGHVWLPVEELGRTAAETLAVDLGRVEEVLRELPAGGRVVLDGERVYRSDLHRAERSVAARLRALASAGGTTQGEGAEPGIGRVERLLGIDFDERQKRAILESLHGGLFVLTGGPGTGKTTITLAIIDLWEALGRRVLLAAPTGRAAKKLSEATSRPASTIHRMLEFNARTGEFGRNEMRPLAADVVLVDEVSMVDLLLMESVLRAFPEGATLVLVGDADQLPSVGPGNVLGDILRSGVVRSVRLEQIFRQVEQSRIVLNAHRINRGEFPHLSDRSREFAFISEERPEGIPDLVRTLCTETLPQQFGFDPMEDIQVLSPMYRGPAGATNLNQVLQDALNAEGIAVPFGGRRFRLGDRVMQVRNDYEKEVFNGDLGRIIGMDGEGQAIHVTFDAGTVSYRGEEMDDLVLAYAVTVHKSQGSEYRAVVVPIVTQHYVMLQRKLLYTAVTRARDLVVLVGSRRAVAIAVRNDRAPERYSSLGDRLAAEEG